MKARQKLSTSARKLPARAGLRRRRVELESIKARNHLAGLDDRAPARLTLRRDGEVLEANLNAAKLLGLERDRFIHQKFTRFVSAEERDKFQLFFRKVFREDAWQNVDLHMMNAQARHLVVQVDAVRDREYPRKQCHFCLTDRTAREQAKEALRNGEERYRVLFTSSHDALMTLEPPGWTFTSGNLACVEMFRAGNEKRFVATAPWELSPEFQPDGRRSSEAALAMIDKAMRLGRHFFEWRHRRLDGEEFPATVLLTRVELEGRTFLQATVRDITEQKRTEEQLLKLSLAVEQSPVSILITDASGAIEYVNPNFAKLTGYTADEVRGKNPRLLKSGETPVETYQRLWQTITQGRVWRGELHNRKKDGQLFWESISISPMTTADGRITHFVAVKEDVTERKQAEQALRESEERFRLLANATYEGICISENGRILDVNDQLLKMLGCQRDEMVGEDVLNFVAPDSSITVAEAIRNHRETIYEHQMRRKDGSFLDVETQAKMMRFGNRKLRVAATRDITERKRAAEVLLRSQERYEMAERAVNDGLWDWNILTDEEYFSPRYKEIIGYRVGDLPNHKSSFLNNIHPDDRATVDEATRRHLEQGERYALEFRLRHKNGSYRWVYSRGEAVRDDNGRPVRMVGGVTDITERKLAEESVRENEARFQQLANSITDVFWIASPDLRKIDYVSPGYERIWGRTSESLYANPQQWVEAILPEDQNRVVDILASLMAAKSEVGVEYRISRPDGAIRWVLDRGFQVRDARGEVIRLTGVSSDITERKRLEGEILTERERLEREVLRRIEMEQVRIGRDLHDGLCQILVGAKYRTGVLEKMLSEKNVSSAAVEAKVVERMLNKSIQQARDLSKGLNPVSLETKGLTFALEELAKEIETSGVARCKCQCCPAAFIPDGEVVTHFYRITQEAVHNAVKHGKGRSISINLREQSGTLVLTVENDGVGFKANPETLAGAGLHNIRMRTAAIGGTLVIGPRQGGGTVVSVSLPAKTRQG